MKKKEQRKTHEYYKNHDKYRFFSINIYKLFCFNDNHLQYITHINIFPLHLPKTDIPTHNTSPIQNLLKKYNTDLGSVFSAIIYLTTLL